MKLAEAVKKGRSGKSAGAKGSKKSFPATGVLLLSHQYPAPVPLLQLCTCLLCSMRLHCRQKYSLPSSIMQPHLLLKTFKRRIELSSRLGESEGNYLTSTAPIYLRSTNGCWDSSGSLRAVSGQSPSQSETLSALTDTRGYGTQGLFCVQFEQNLMARRV